jgi:hypothetical protein
MAYSVDQIKAIITQVAQQYGVDPNLAIAVARLETAGTFDPTIPGDGGHSIGLFQLSDKGEGAGMSVAARSDPVANATIAIKQIANVMKSNPGLSPGQLAVAAQRPAASVRAAYAAEIDKAVGNQLSPEQYADTSVAGRAYLDQALAADNTSANTGSDTASTASGLEGLLQSQAPALAAELSDPQVKALLAAWAAPGGMSTQVFTAQLQATAWWKKTPLGVRQQLVSKATDPATVAQQQADQETTIRSLATNLGVTLSQAAISKIANAALTDPTMSAPAMQAQIVAAAQTQFGANGSYSGQAGSDVAQLVKAYHDYAVPVTDAQINAQVRQMLSTNGSTGEATFNGILSQIVQSAKTLYGNNPQLANSLSTTASVQDFLNPYIAKAAGTLGVNANTIDPRNSQQWAFLLKPSTDVNGQSTGQALTLDDLQQKIQTDPTFGFSKTSNGVAAYQSVADSLRNVFSGGSKVG